MGGGSMRASCVSEDPRTTGWSRLAAFTAYGTVVSHLRARSAQPRVKNRDYRYETVGGYTMTTL